MKKLIVKFFAISTCCFTGLSGEYLDIPRDGRRFSSLNEEGVLQSILSKVSDINPFYVDVGAGDGINWSNTAKLVLNGWRGVAVDFDGGKVAACQKAYQKFPQVKVCQAKVMPTNVISLFNSYKVPTDFGVLSLDIDSYEYFVVEELLKGYRPTIMIVEINEKVPPPLEFTVLFDENHGWQGDHFFGVSLSLLAKLAAENRYALVALEYNNAFLVDQDKYPGPSLTATEAYNSGYVFRPDRKRWFPWNSNMEGLLKATPQQAVDFLNIYFSNYEGKYSLTVGDK